MKDVKEQIEVEDQLIVEEKKGRGTAPPRYEVREYNVEELESMSYDSEKRMSRSSDEHFDER